MGWKDELESLPDADANSPAVPPTSVRERFKEQLGWLFEKHAASLVYKAKKDVWVFDFVSISRQDRPEEVARWLATRTGVAISLVYEAPSRRLADGTSWLNGPAMNRYRLVFRAAGIQEPLNDRQEPSLRQPQICWVAWHEDRSHDTNDEQSQLDATDSSGHGASTRLAAARNIPAQAEGLLKQWAMIIAMHVRNSMEEFHCKYLSDDQMRELNPIVRNAIYQAIRSSYLVRNGLNEDQQLIGLADVHRWLLMVPNYWEPPEERKAVSPDVAQFAEETLEKRVPFRTDKSQRAALDFVTQLREHF